MRDGISKRSFCFVLITAGFWGASPVKIAAQATNSLLDKLLRFARVEGHDQKLGPTVTETLGLTKRGETMIVRQVAVSEEGNDNWEIAFNVPPNMPGVFILIWASKARIVACRVDKDLHFVSGYSFEAGARPVIMSAADGQKEVARQLDLWSQFQL